MPLSPPKERELSPFRTTVRGYSRPTHMHSLTTPKAMVRRTAAATSMPGEIHGMWLRLTTRNNSSWRARPQATIPHTPSARPQPTAPLGRTADQARKLLKEAAKRIGGTIGLHAPA